MRTPDEKSKRTPEYSTRFNFADYIERYLQEDGHRTWGSVIYRCTYDSDDDWEEFLLRFKYHTEKALEGYNGLDMLPSLCITVFDDKSMFDDASTAAIRDHFKQWSAAAPQREQDTEEGLSPRYRYCIQIDYESLESIVKDAPAPPEIDTTCIGYVNLIWRDWDPLPPDLRVGPESPIEGCTEHDVGWMMTRYQDVMVGMQYYLRGRNSWHIEYKRPPEVGSF